MKVCKSINQSISYFLEWPKQPKSQQGRLKCHRQKDGCSKNVFNWCPKDCNVGAETMCSARKFQIWSAATRKARLPTVENLTGGTTSRLVPAERSAQYAVMFSMHIWQDTYYVKTEKKTAQNYTPLTLQHHITFILRITCTSGCRLVRLCSRLTALRRFINFVLLLLLLHRFIRLISKTISNEKPFHLRSSYCNNQKWLSVSTTHTHRVYQYKPCSAAGWLSCSNS